jgi:hypothetical protein
MPPRCLPLPRRCTVIDYSVRAACLFTAQNHSLSWLKQKCPRRTASGAISCGGSVAAGARRRHLRQRWILGHVRRSDPRCYSLLQLQTVMARTSSGRPTAWRRAPRRCQGVGGYKSLVVPAADRPSRRAGIAAKFRKLFLQPTREPAEI